MTNPAAAELFPGSLAWSFAGAAWAWGLALLLGASLLPRGPEPEPADPAAPRPCGGRLLAFAVTGVLAQSMAWLLLSFFGALRPAVVIAAALAMTAAALVAGGRRVAAELQALRREPSSDGSWPVASWVAAAVAVAFGLVVLRLALVPTVFYDDMTYHLGLPRQALLTGSWPALDAFHYSFLPATWDITFVLPLALGGGGGPQLMNVVALALLAWAAWRVAWRAGGRAAAALVTCLLIVAPMTCSLGAFAGNDLFVALALAVALDRLLETRAGRPVEVGVLAAAAWGAKYAALPAVAGLALAAVVLASGAWTRRLGAGLVLGITAVLVPCAWTLRTWWLTGSPLYPAFHGLLGGGAFDATSAFLVARDSAHGAFPARGVAAFAHAPWEMLARSEALGHPGGVNPAFVALAYLGLLAFRRVRDATALGAVIGVAFVGWCLTSLNLRYAIVLLVALAPFAARLVSLAMEAAARRVPRAGVDALAAAALVALCAPSFVGAVRSHAEFTTMESPWSLEPRGDFLVRRMPLAAAGRAMAGNLPDGARVLMVGDGRLALVPRPADASSAYDPPNVLRLLEGVRSPEDLTRRVAAEFTHVLVNREQLPRLDREFGYGSRLTPEQAGILSAWLAGLPRVAEWRGITLHELAPPASP